ncbi:hypothetical protein ACNOYE_23240 [Nannocystaceae bacterium ST9]
MTSAPPPVPTSTVVARAIADLGSVGDVVLESLTVDTAARKFMEIDRDATPAVVAGRSTFLADMAGALASAPSESLLDAMASAGGLQLGLGPEPGFDMPSPPTLRSASSLSEFYAYNISTGWKMITAIGLGLPPTPPSYEGTDSPVYAAWLAEIANATIPSDMIDQGSLASAAQSWSWWTPDARMALPPAADGPSSNAGTQTFFAQCWVVSLAPEWYPDGFVTFSFEFDASLDQLRRPTPYDGTTSPLWVQRPADQSPATGGDAIETLLGSALPVTRLAPIPTTLISPTLSAALAAAPSVNVYAQNLCLVNPGSDDTSRTVAAWQILITEQCRLARAGSDAGFDAALIAATCPCGTSHSPNSPKEIAS